MNIRKFIRKFKIGAKKLLTVIVISIIEIIWLLWANDWVATPILFAPLVQLALIIEKKKIWSSLSDKEKEKILISEDTLSGLVKGVIVLSKNGDDADSIVEKIKKG